MIVPGSDLSTGVLAESADTRGCDPDSTCWLSQLSGAPALLAFGNLQAETVTSISTHVPPYLICDP